MWRSVIPELSDLVSLGFWDNPRRSRFRRPPDVWLHDGHQGSLGVPEPSVIHLQEASWTHPSTHPHLRAEFLATYERASREAVESARRVITPSESSRAQILDLYDLDPSHVVVVPFGVDHELFRPGRPGAGDIIAGAGGDPTRPYVLYVSTVQPRKNLSALRAAMTGLAERGLPHGLVVVAAPPQDRDDYADLFAAAGAELAGFPGRVILLRDISDVELAALMAAAAAFCLPSLMEGFGLTVLEAMACGTPVVVSDRGSLPEVVGDAGIVCEPDAASVEAALYGLLTNPERMATLGQQARTRSLTFTWKATAQAWCAVLHEAVPAPRRGVVARMAPSSGPIARLLDYGIRVPLRRRRTAHSPN